MDRGAWWATVHGVAESDTTEQLTLKDIQPWASLVVQWLRIHVPMQGTWV